MSSEWDLAFMVASVALAVTIVYTAKAWFAHRERMAKIQRGMDPDQPLKKDALE
jgi:hypothetical protein